MSAAVPMLLAAALSGTAVPAATPVTIAGLARHEVGDAGATMPFLEYEAENAQGNATPIGPGRTAGTLAAEASGRRAVRLERAGQSITITLAAASNALTIRYSLPDSADGRGLSATLALTVDGKVLATMPMTSRFGHFYGAYPFTNRPRDGKAHHFWDERRLLLPRVLQAGARLTLSTLAGVSLRPIAIDLVDAEIAPPPLASPANALSLAQFGADPTGVRSARPALLRAITAAQRQRRPVYIPPGRFRVDGHVVIDQVTIAGAGAWHSLITGSGLGFYGQGRQGSSYVSVSNLALESDVGERRDHAPLAAIGGTFSNSSFSDLFISHAKVGVWIDGPATGILLRRLRISDLTADGINLRRAVTDSVIEQNFIRNSGDDGIALWSHREADRRVAIRHNTIVAPMLANGIALYGGGDIAVTGNLVADTVTQGGGIHLGSRFAAAPFSGRIDVAGNVLVRTGSLDPNWHFGTGALWFYALERPIDGASIAVRGTRAIDSSCEVLQSVGPYPVSNIRIEGLDASGSGGALAAIQTRGSMVIANTSTPGGPAPEILSLPAGFRLVDGGGNRGWTSRRVEGVTAPTCAPAIREWAESEAR